MPRMNSPNSNAVYRDASGARWRVGRIVKRMDAFRRSFVVNYVEMEEIPESWDAYARGEGTRTLEFTEWPPPGFTEIA